VTGVLKRSDRALRRRIGERWVLIPVHRNLVDLDNLFWLNLSGAFIWERLNGKNTLDDICWNVMEEYKVDRPTAEADVRAFTDELLRAGLAVRLAQPARRATVHGAP
jgi:hypothetical protein